MSDSRLLEAAAKIIRPLPFVLAPLASDPLTEAFPLEPGEEPHEEPGTPALGSLNTAALAYLDHVATPSFRAAAKALDDLGLEGEGAVVRDLIRRAHQLIFTVHAALSSIGHVPEEGPVSEGHVMWACDGLVRDLYASMVGTKLAGKEVASAPR